MKPSQINASVSAGALQRIPFLLLLCAMLWAIPGHAQVNATISGTVKDSAGAAIVGATVTVTSLENGTHRVTTTDREGNFRVLSLPLGPQEVKAARPGFKAALRTGINLEVGQDVVVNLTLEVGALDNEAAVVVDEAVPDVDVSDAGLFRTGAIQIVQVLHIAGRFRAADRRQPDLADGRAMPDRGFAPRSPESPYPLAAAD